MNGVHITKEKYVEQLNKNTQKTQKTHTLKCSIIMTLECLCLCPGAFASYTTPYNRLSLFTVSDCQCHSVLQSTLLSTVYTDCCHSTDYSFNFRGCKANMYPYKNNWILEYPIRCFLLFLFPAIWVTGRIIDHYSLYVERRSTPPSNLEACPGPPSSIFWNYLSKIINLTMGLALPAWVSYELRLT